MPSKWREGALRISLPYCEEAMRLACRALAGSLQSAELGGQVQRDGAGADRHGAAGPHALLCRLIQLQVRNAGYTSLFQSG